jgi:hypothetical protein
MTAVLLFDEFSALVERRYSKLSQVRKHFRDEEDL